MDWLLWVALYIIFTILLAFLHNNRKRMALFLSLLPVIGWATCTMLLIYASATSILRLIGWL